MRAESLAKRTSTLFSQQNSSGPWESKELSENQPQTTNTQERNITMMSYVVPFLLIFPMCSSEKLLATGSPRHEVFKSSSYGFQNRIPIEYAEYQPLYVMNKMSSR